jgi:hypothetical protein
MVVSGQSCDVRPVGRRTVSSLLRESFRVAIVTLRSKLTAIATVTNLIVVESFMLVSTSEVCERVRKCG